MTTLSPSWNTDINFWILNTAIKTLAVFNQYYKSDKSKDKKDSSKIMWAIALLIDPNEKNPWKNVNPVEKKQLISTEFLNDPKFNWDDEKIQNLILNYKNLCLTVAEKSLVEFEEKLADRARFISNAEYTFDWYEETERGVKLMKGTATQLDKMMTDTKKIYDQFELIKQQLLEESINIVGKAGAVESASESGIL